MKTNFALLLYTLNALVFTIGVFEKLLIFISMLCNGNGPASKNIVKGKIVKSFSNNSFEILTQVLIITNPNSRMALEALCGVPKRSFMAESRLFDHEELEDKDEILASFPNADDPMKVLTPPFVREVNLIKL